MSVYQFNIRKKDLQLAEKKLYQRLRKITPKKYAFLNIVITIVLWIPVGFGWAYAKDHYGHKISLALIGIVVCVLLSGKLGHYIGRKYLNYLKEKERKDTVKVRLEIQGTTLKLETDESATIFRVRVKIELARRLG